MAEFAQPAGKSASIVINFVSVKFRKRFNSSSQVSRSFIASERKNCSSESLNKNGEVIFPSSFLLFAFISCLPSSRRETSTHYHEQFFGDVCSGFWCDNNQHRHSNHDSAFFASLFSFVARRRGKQGKLDKRRQMMTENKTFFLLDDGWRLLWLCKIKTRANKKSKVARKTTRYMVGNGGRQKQHQRQMSAKKCQIEFAWGERGLMLAISASPRRELFSIFRSRARVACFFW